MTNKILSSLSIRSLQTVEELEDVRKLEALVWSMEDSVPVTQVVASIKNGGFVLGAYLNGFLIGFQYSFPGFDGKKVYLYSHSLGIHPEYRKFGIGEKLKLAQKELAIQKGYDLITWTFDPLETVNGNLNLHKLGAVCSKYVENAYGEIPDDLNAGIPSDRFLVEWWIKEPNQTEKNNHTNILPLTIKTVHENDYILAAQIDLTHENNKLLVPVPGNFQEIKKKDFSKAIEWRKTTRQVFTHYLTLGWIVTDLLRDFENQHQYLYLLENKIQGDNKNGN
ncbi:MAG: GNAT family N-acetyltransferase [Bacillota bacterium]